MLSTLLLHLWLRNLLRRLKIVPHSNNPGTLYSDSMLEIYSKDCKFHDQTKYIEISYHFIENKKEELILNYIPTNQMVTDPLTKPLVLDLFRSHVKAMSLRRWWCNITKFSKICSFNVNKIFSYCSYAEFHITYPIDNFTLTWWPHANKRGRHQCHQVFMHKRSLMNTQQERSKMRMSTFSL